MPDKALGVVFLASKVNNLSDAIICPTHYRSLWKKNTLLHSQATRRLSTNSLAYGTLTLNIQHVALGNDYFHNCRGKESQECNIIQQQWPWLPIWGIWIGQQTCSIHTTDYSIDQMVCVICHVAPHPKRHVLASLAPTEDTRGREWFGLTHSRLCRDVRVLTPHAGPAAPSRQLGNLDNSGRERRENDLP